MVVSNSRTRTYMAIELHFSALARSKQEDVWGINLKISPLCFVIYFSLINSIVLTLLINNKVSPSILILCSAPRASPIAPSSIKVSPAIL